MSQAIHLELEVPDDLARLRLPAGVQQRLTELLDKQDTGTTLTDAERREAEGLVDLAELLSLLRLRSERMSSRSGREEWGIGNRTPSISSQRYLD
jgi:hypothetical protein